MMVLPGIADDRLAGLLGEVQTAIRSAFVVDAGREAACAILSNLYLDGAFTQIDPGPEFARRVQAYLATGLATSLSPGPLFDAAFIREREGLAVDSSALVHWLKSGGNVATTPVLDAPWYARTHRDVTATGQAPALHYVTRGVHQNLAPSQLWHDLARQRPLDVASLCRAQRDRSLGVSLGFPWLSFLPRDPGPLGELGFLTETLAAARAVTLADLPFMLALYEFVPADGGDREWMEEWLAFLRHGRRDHDIGGYCDLRTLDALLNWIRHGRLQRHLPNDAFSEADYFAVNPDLRGGPRWGFDHYVVDGRLEGRRPTSAVDPLWYRAVHDLPTRLDPFTAWATGEKAGAGELGLVPVQEEGESQPVAPLAEQARAAWLKRFGLVDLPKSIRSGPLAAAIDRAAALDPLVRGGRVQHEIIVPQVRHANVAVSKRIRLGVREALAGRMPDVVILMTGRGIGGAERFSENIALATGRLGLTALAVSTDQPDDQRRPPLAFSYDFASATRHVAENERPSLLVDMLFGLGCRTVLNVNSRICWNALHRHAAALSQHFAIACSLFGWDYDDGSRRLLSFAEHFPHVYPFVRRFVFDNQTFSNELKTLYGLSADDPKLTTLYSALSLERKKVTQAVSLPVETPRGSTVFWSGRVRKRFDIVQRVATLMPDVHFFCWGPQGDIANLPANLHLLPPHSPETPPPFERAGAWLFTSDHEGLPNTLVEAGMQGMRVVASRVGGVGELITPETGWPVAGDDPADYAAALREALGGTPESERRAAALHARCRTVHSEDAFVAGVGRLLEALNA